MKIGLIDIEPKVFNTAYMQLAAYHRQRGDSVDWWSPLTGSQFDHVYCSSLFTYTDKSEVPKRAICGGTGFDLNSRLSQAIEACELDYSLYPDCETSYLWFSRGCIRNCKFCCIQQKEGHIRPVTPKNLNPVGQYITVMDNNFFSNPAWTWAIDWLQKANQPIIIEQGIDVWLLNEEMCKALLTLKNLHRIRIAWDNPRENPLPQIKFATKYFKPYRLTCYVLIGFWSTEEQDLYRVETLRDLGIDPFVMPYDKNDLYQKAFARWVNHKAIFKKVKWLDYYYRVQTQEAQGCGWAKG